MEEESSTTSRPPKRYKKTSKIGELYEKFEGDRKTKSGCKEIMWSSLYM